MGPSVDSLKTLVYGDRNLNLAIIIEDELDNQFRLEQNEDP